MTGNGALPAKDRNGAGNFDFQRGRFKTAKNLNVWAIVRLGQMRVSDDDLEYFEKIMNQTARGFGMNLEVCTDYATKTHRQGSTKSPAIEELLSWPKRSKFRNCPVKRREIHLLKKGFFISTAKDECYLRNFDCPPWITGTSNPTFKLVWSTIASFW